MPPSALATPDQPPELSDPSLDWVAAAEGYLAAGDLRAAVEVAQAAAAASPRNSRAQLLSALALARIRVEMPDEICAWAATPAEIEAHLQAAWVFDDDIIERLHEDPALAAIPAAAPNSLGLRLWPSRGRAWKSQGRPQSVTMAGLPVRRLEGVLKPRVAASVVSTTTWHSVSAEGALTGGQLSLLPDGRAERRTTRLDADGEAIESVVAGSWELKKATIKLQLPGEPTEMVVTLDGLLAQTDAKGTPLEESVLAYGDQAPECALMDTRSSL
ncbi:MAG: hypothetical protein AB8H79_02220 [Myxococcota bacterium]